MRRISVGCRFNKSVVSMIKQTTPATNRGFLLPAVEPDYSADIDHNFIDTLATSARLVSSCSVRDSNSSQ